MNRLIAIQAANISGMTIAPALRPFHSPNHRIDL
jgi:hypothetical protein